MSFGTDWNCPYGSDWDFLARTWEILAHIEFPLDIILVRVLHDANNADRVVEVFQLTEDDIQYLLSIFLGENEGYLDKIRDFVPEIYRAQLKKGQEYLGSGA